MALMHAYVLCVSPVPEAGGAQHDLGRQGPMPRLMHVTMGPISSAGVWHVGASCVRAGQSARGMRASTHGMLLMCGTRAATADTKRRMHLPGTSIVTLTVHRGNH